MILEDKEIRSIIEQLKKELLPIGSILIYPSENVPSNFLPCDGRNLSKALYPELYKLIKGTWGETEDTFSLPDLQGQFVRGWDKEGNVDPERKFGQFQEDAFQGHGHKLKIDGETSKEGSHAHSFFYHQYTISYGTNTFSSDNISDIVKYFMSKDGYERMSKYSSDFYKEKIVESSGTHTHALPPISVIDPQTCVNGIVTPQNETRPKNIALMFCMKVK